MEKTDYYFPEKVSRIDVQVGDTHSGILKKAARHEFNYDDVESPAISLTMARSEDKMGVITYGALHPIFRQNLPEGYVRHYIHEKLFRLNRNIKVDDMFLLALQMDNGIGQLNYQSEIQLPTIQETTLTEILKWDSQEALFPQLLEKHYLKGMLSGVQPKVLINSERASVHQKDFIVKSFDEELDLLTVNEFVCMSAAKHCGLNPPNFYLSENLENFVIDRFDYDEAGKKIGFEDFTTLLKKGDSFDAKYTGSYENLLKVVAGITHSKEQVELAYRYIVFNCLIGNGDAHLKNFALQYNADLSDIRLTPPYDITHTQIYPTLDKRLALKLDNDKAFPDKKALIKLASAVPGYEIYHPEVIINELADGIMESIENSAEIDAFTGLKKSIQTNVMAVKRVAYNPKGYRHKKKKKFDFET